MINNVQSSKLSNFRLETCPVSLEVWYNNNSAAVSSCLFSEGALTGNLLVSALLLPSSMISVKRELHRCKREASETNYMTSLTTQTLTHSVGGLFGEITVFIDLRFDRQLFDLDYFLQHFLECVVNLNHFLTELLKGSVVFWCDNTYLKSHKLLPWSQRYIFYICTGLLE